MSLFALSSLSVASAYDSTDDAKSASAVKVIAAEPSAAPAKHASGHDYYGHKIIHGHGNKYIKCYIDYSNLHSYGHSDEYPKPKYYQYVKCYNEGYYATYKAEYKQGHLDGYKHGHKAGYAGKTYLKDYLPTGHKGYTAGYLKGYGTGYLAGDSNQGGRKAGYKVGRTAGYWAGVHGKKYVTYASKELYKHHGHGYEDYAAYGVGYKSGYTHGYKVGYKNGALQYKK